MIRDVPREGTIHVRLLLRDSEDQFWSAETLKIGPPALPEQRGGPSGVGVDDR